MTTKSMTTGQVRRTSRDGIPATRTADAVQPAVDAILRLEEKYDSLVKRVEDARRAERKRRVDRRQDKLREYFAQPIKAGFFQTIGYSKLSHYLARKPDREDD